MGPRIHVYIRVQAVQHKRTGITAYIITVHLYMLQCIMAYNDLYCRSRCRGNNVFTIELMNRAFYSLELDLYNYIYSLISIAEVKVNVLILVQVHI